MDINTLITVAAALGVGLGGFFSGRLTGRYNSHQIASQTVEMLQAQVEVLEHNKEERELTLLDLTQRVSVLEGLVTQRAAVEELSVKVDLVKSVVDRIGVRVGA
jgi:hypothetical protein